MKLPYACTLKVINNECTYPTVLIDRGDKFELVIVGFEYYNRGAFLKGHYAYGEVLATCSKKGKLPDIEELFQVFPLMKSHFALINPEEEDEVFFHLVMEAPTSPKDRTVTTVMSSVF